MSVKNEKRDAMVYPRPSLPLRYGRGSGGGAITRREALASVGAAAAIAMTACGVEQRAFAQSKVSIVKAPAYDQSVYDTMRRIVAEHAGDVRGKRILLKPNLVEF